MDEDWFQANAPQTQADSKDWFAQNAPQAQAPPVLQQTGSTVVAEPSILQKTGRAVVDTLKGFLPQSLSEVALAPVNMIPGFGQAVKPLENIAFGRPISEGVNPLAGIPVVQRIPEIIAAEKTPALSQERFTTGAGVVSDLAMVAGLKSALHPELAEVAGIPKPEAAPETPLTTEAKAAPIVTEPPVTPEPVAQPVPAAESVTTAPLPPEPFPSLLVSAEEQRRIEQNAIQEPSTGAILQRQPQEVGTTGGERVGVEPSVQGQEPTEALQASAPQEKVVLGPNATVSDGIAAVEKAVEPWRAHSDKTDALRANLGYALRKYGNGPLESETIDKINNAISDLPRYMTGDVNGKPPTSEVPQIQPAAQEQVAAVPQPEQPAITQLFADRSLMTPEQFRNESGIAGSDIDKAYQHKVALRETAKVGGELNAKSVDEYGLELPEGYVKQGDSYVKPTPTPKEEASAAVPPTEGTGGANVAAMEQRPIETPEVGQGISQEQTRAAGHEWLDKGGDINKVMADFNRTGKINEWDVGKGSAYLERLQSVTDKASDALRENPNDPALQERYSLAKASEQKFSDAFKPMATTASNTLKGFQGKTTLTDEMADSFSGLDRKFREFQGKEMTPEEAVKADRLARKNAKAKSDYSEANQNLYKNADETYKAVKGPSHVPTIQELAKALTGALEEVC